MIYRLMLALLLISSASAIDINLNVSAEGNGYKISEAGSWSCLVWRRAGKR